MEKNIEYRTESKLKTKIIISVSGVTIKLAKKDVIYENEIIDYAITLRRKLLINMKLAMSIRIKVNYIDGSVFRYKYAGIKYNGETLRQVMILK